jgi:hypothetical protein
LGFAVFFPFALSLALILPQIGPQRVERPARRFLSGLPVRLCFTNLNLGNLPLDCGMGRDPEAGFRGTTFEEF